MKINRFIAVDPGASGGIALYRVNQQPAASCFKMPARIEIFSSWLVEQKEIAQGDLIVMIEHQMVFHTDQENNNGRQFAMAKLLKNFNQLCAACQIAGVKHFTVMPVSWQSGYKRIKGETKTQRKNRYKESAATYFDYLKITLNTADALCMLQFLKTKLQFDSEWVEARIKNQT